MGAFWMPLGVLLWHRPWRQPSKVPPIRAQALDNLDQWECSTLLIGERYNVMTLNQTVLLVVLLNLDSIFFGHLLSASVQSRLQFNLEMLRIILIENMFFKCFVPIYLIRNSRTHLKSLWSDRKPERLKFFMSKQSVIGRPVISKYEGSDLETAVCNTDRRLGSYSYTTSQHVTVTTHEQADNQPGELASVV